MSKRTICRAACLLLTAGLFVVAVLPTEATKWETAVSAVRTRCDLSCERSGPEPERARQIGALLRRYGLTEEQEDALRVRMEADGELLALLEEERLTEDDLARLALPNARADRLERYGAWAAGHPELPAEDVVLQVNMDRDRDPYSQIGPAEDPGSLTVLVNKHTALPEDYVPQLETLGTIYGSGSLRPEAAVAFRAMADSAREDGISLYSVSAYRSYKTQKNLYARYLRRYKQSTVDTFSARAGHSEHQTGLALDINVASVSAHFEDTPAYAWLRAHCAEYGFLLRYDEGKESVTGYRFEPWHYRYVGPEAARACMDQGLAYEEYLALLPCWGVENDLRSTGPEAVLI